MSSSPRIEDILPLTACQDFFLAGESGSGVHSIHVYGYRLAGKVDPVIARQVWSEIVAAYPSLRTSLHVLSPGRAFQVVHRAARPEFRVFDLRHMPREEAAAEVSRYQEADSSILFDWRVPPLFRLALHRLGEAESILSLTIDHLIFDGWSLGLAIRDFLKGCEALDGGGDWHVPPAPSIREYLLWHRRQDVRGAQDWLRGAMRGLPSQRLPFAECSRWPDRVCATEVHFLPLAEEDVRSLNDGAQRLGVTLYTLFQGAWALILSHCQEGERAYFLSTSASRPAELAGIQALFGLLLGVLPYCLPCARASRVGDWLNHIRAYHVEAMQYHFVPPADVVGVQKELAPLAQTCCLVFQNMDTGTGREPGAPGGIAVSAGGLVSRSGYPLVVGAQVHSGLQLSLMYDSRIFSRHRIASLAELLRAVMLALSRREDVCLGDICALDRIQGGLREVAASVAQGG